MGLVVGLLIISGVIAIILGAAMIYGGVNIVRVYKLKRTNNIKVSVLRYIIGIVMIVLGILLIAICLWYIYVAIKSAFRF